MNKMLGLIKRNLLIYFKDKSSVVFSMMTPIIVLVLYLLFLRGTYVNGIENAAEAVRDFISLRDINSFTSGLLLSGILGSAMITVPYNTLSTLVYDRETKVDYDLCATPIKRPQIILSYYISSVISAFIMTAAIFTLGLLIIAGNNDMYLSATAVIRLYGLMLLGSMSSTALFMPILLLFKKSSAVGAFMGIVSSASGFIIGAYIPLSEFSEVIQTFCNFFPATGITILLKKNMLGNLLEHINTAIGGYDNGIFADTIKEVFGLNGKMFGHNMNSVQTVYYILAVTTLFILAITLIYPRVYKKK